MKLAVSETFYSIQGEGQTMGIPSVFLRLGGCNLLCESKSWRCDTIEVWQKSKAKEFKDVLAPELIERIREGAHLIITGGEPLMQQKVLIEYIYYLLNEHDLEPVIEIETNGTVLPSVELDEVVSFWNVSPKLSNAGSQNTPEMRINQIALKFFNETWTKVIYKFVVSNDADIQEVLNEYLPLVDAKKVWLMPAGSTQDQLAETRLLTAENCRKLGFKYSERLHIVIWNMKTGV